MDDEPSDLAAARVAAAIGEPARARMLYALMDGRARTGTELGALADINASTASAHLQRLTADQLVAVVAQGRYRYYKLRSKTVARVLEGLNVLGGGVAARFEPSTPSRLREARTCYDHLAGTIAVRLHDRLISAGWLTPAGSDYSLASRGDKALGGLGVDVARARTARRRFAYGCLDWSERRPHLGGALGAGLLEVLLRRRWFERDDDSRALSLTPAGRRELAARFGLSL